MSSVSVVNVDAGLRVRLLDRDLDRCLLLLRSALGDLEWLDLRLRCLDES